VYGATKGAVASLTYAWAVEFASRGVRVNAVSPLADTRMFSATAAFLAERGVRSHRRSPAPESNAPAVVYLLAHAWDRFHDHPNRKVFARAMVPIVLGLSWVGSTILARGAIDGWATASIALAATAAMLASRTNPAIIVGAAGVIGALLFR